MSEEFDPNKILRTMSISVDTIRQLVTNEDGKVVGLKNALKQLMAQTGQTGTAVVVIDGKKITAVLKNWTPARSGVGYEGEEVIPHGVSASEMASKYFSGFKPENAPKEAAYLLAFLAMSVLNGRTPTSGAPNLETSHKANILRIELEKYENVSFESVTIPGAVHVKTGHQFPDLIATDAMIREVAKYASTNSMHMLAEMGRKPSSRDGINRGGDGDVLSM
jgi:hypothetical protein